MKILIITFTEIQSDPRVLRQIAALQGHKLSVCGYGGAPNQNHTTLDVSASKPTRMQKLWAGILLITRQYKSRYWKAQNIQHARRLMEAESYDLLIANDLESLPLAIEHAKGSPVIFDAHEYSPQQFNNIFFNCFSRPYRMYLCNTYLRRCGRVFSVCDGIADLYEKTFKITRPTVITNAAISWTPKKIKPLDPSRIRLIHHGGVNRSRRLDLMIKMMEHLDPRFELHFMLAAPAHRIRKLRKIATGKPVYFHEPVSFSQITETISVYDIGVYLLPPTNINNTFALPNKFFEFIQARLPIAVGPSPEMAKLINQYGAGVVAQSFDPQSLASAIEKIVKNYNYHREAIGKMAQLINAENEAKKIRMAVEELA